MKTYTPKASEIQREWHVVDADGLILGRLATEVARVLRGKHKPTFAPHIDTGDHVVVINADKVIMSRNKMTTKRVYRHSGYPGGMSSESYGEFLIASRPTPCATRSRACCPRARSAGRRSPSSRCTPVPTIRTPPRPPSR